MNALNETTAPGRTLPDDPLEARFNALATIWKVEVNTLRHFSLPFHHHSILAIIAMGDAALPFIFRDMRTDGLTPWYNPLSRITGLDLLNHHDRYTSIWRDKWFKWGMENGFVRD